MKPEQIYQHLKDLADRLNVSVSEQNFRRSGIRVKSGYCIVNGKHFFIMDKHKGLNEKIDLLASFLGTRPHEGLYLLPTVRELINKYAEERGAQTP